MTKIIKRVSVIGLGYLGLPTAVMLAAKGIKVIGVDIDADRVAIVNSGASPIKEPNLDTMVSQAVAAGKLSVQSEPAKADAFIIAVPTPVKGEDHNPDLSLLYNAMDELAPTLEAGNLILVESTSPVGTTETICEQLAKARSDLSFPHVDGENSDIRVAYCPERMLPGKTLDELVKNDRVIGGVTLACATAAKELYQIFVQGNFYLTTARTGEFVKLAENAYRDVNIAFANEISLVCDALDIDQWEVIDLANHHPRVDILKPGPGVGGHCIPVDPWFIVHSEPKLTPLTRTARQVNDSKPDWVVHRIITACKEIDNPVVACLGLTYKADVGDLRESPAVAVIKQLQASLSGRVLVVEPHISALPAELTGDNKKTELVDLDTALGVADIIALLTGHREFSCVDYSQLSGRLVIDPHGFWAIK